MYKINFALDFVGLPAIIRPSFTLGGTGGGIATTEKQFDEIANSGLYSSPISEILIEESGEWRSALSARWLLLML